MFLKDNLRKIKKSINGGPSFVGRGLTVFNDDIFVTSYPKSGNTWTRFLIANLLFPDEEIGFSNIERKIPDIYQNTEKQLLELPRTRIIKSHEYFDPRYQKVILIVRDPRDVLISTYFHYLKYDVLDETVSLDDFGTGFLSNEYNGVGSNILGNWGENVGSWLGAREGTPNFLLIRYEDLKENTGEQLRRIADFLEVGCSASIVQNAISNSSVDRMRRLERQEKNVWPSRQSKREDISFIRSAKAGGWKESLQPSLVENIHAQWGSVMSKLGYLS